MTTRITALRLGSSQKRRSLFLSHVTMNMKDENLFETNLNFETSVVIANYFVINCMNFKSFLPKTVADISLVVLVTLIITA